MHEFVSYPDWVTLPAASKQGGGGTGQSLVCLVNATELREILLTVLKVALGCVTKPYGAFSWRGIVAASQGYYV